MQVRHAASPLESSRMTTAELRAQYLVENLFGSHEVGLVYTHEDRLVLGGVQPEPGIRVRLPAPPELRSASFLERRELGVINVGRGPGVVRVGGETYTLDARDALYAGRGAGEVEFEGSGEAAFYLVSALAHSPFPTQKLPLAEADRVELGESQTSNRRVIHKLIHEGGARSCQLVMGMTELCPGSVWNTMPPHLHDRRAEVYLYFDLKPDACVVHLMGEPQLTRSLVVRDREAVISPPWSIHAGCGTASYSFVWATGGENQEYGDMDPVAVAGLR